MTNAAKRTALRRAINRYRDAAIADTWKGAGSPADYDAVGADLAQANRLLNEAIKRCLP